MHQEVSSESETRIILISEKTVSSINMDSRIDEILVSKDTVVQNENYSRRANSPRPTQIKMMQSVLSCE